MRYTWIDEYLLSKAGVTKDLQKNWNWICYQIGGKMLPIQISHQWCELYANCYKVMVDK